MEGGNPPGEEVTQRGGPATKHDGGPVGPGLAPANPTRRDQAVALHTRRKMFAKRTRNYDTAMQTCFGGLWFVPH